MPVGALPLSASLPGATAGAGAAGGGLMGLLGGPVGWGLTAASILLPMLGGGGQPSPAPLPPPTPPEQPPPLGGSPTDAPPSQAAPPPQDMASLLQSLPPPPAQADPSMMDKVGGYFDNINRTMDSPTKMLGMKLLDRQDPRLAMAMMAASGFMGEKK